MEINGIEKTEQPKTEKVRELKLKETSRQLEASFLSFVFKAMEKTLPKTSLTGNSENNLASMLFSTTMADAVAEQGGMGLADQIYQSLKETDNSPELNDVTKVYVQSALDAIQMMNISGWDKK